MSLILGLWSAVIKPGETLSQFTSPAIQITNISFGPEVTGDARCVVSMKYPEFEQDEDEDFDSEEDEEEEEEDEDDEEGNIKLPKIITKEAVIGILKPDRTEQVQVNINLVEDVEVVEFSATGPNEVHLVGHYIRQEDFDQDPYSDSEGDSEFDSDDESIDSDLEESVMEGMSGMIDGQDSDEEDEDEDEDDEDDEDEDDDEDEERFEEVVEKKKVNPKKRAAEDEDADVASSLLKSTTGADDSMSSNLSKNQKKKLAKKLKGTDGEAAPAPVVEKKAAAATPAKAEEKKEAAPAKKESSKSQTLPGGLVITDSKKGDGPVAKAGKRVGMRYIGKLDSGKIFDSNTKGKPLDFVLGRGEVIKGWDQGIVGMAVGGERKLTIPAALAYGKKGTQGIPGGATLNFDVKLVSLK